MLLSANHVSDHAAHQVVKYWIPPISAFDRHLALKQPRVFLVEIFNQFITHQNTMMNPEMQIANMTNIMTTLIGPAGPP